MKELIRFLIVSLFVVAEYSSATEVKGLFSAEVITKSQSREDRNLALREAFVVVLNRIAASKGLMLNPEIRDALKNAASYVDQYKYDISTNDSGDIMQRKMIVSFDQQAVMQLMHRGGLKVWNKQRDDVLIWVVIDRGGKQTIFEADHNTDIQEALLAAAQLQGIPVLFPLMDLEERQKMTAADIVNANSENMVDASRRYGVQVVLSGKVTKQRSCWKSEWSLRFNNQQEQWAVPCENLSANLTTAFQEVYQYLSVYYAQKPVR